MLLKIHGTITSFLIKVSCATQKLCNFLSYETPLSGLAKLCFKIISSFVVQKLKAFSVFTMRK